MVHEWLLTAFLTVQTADVTTTCVGFSRGLAEGDPLRPRSCVGVSALQGLTAAGTVYFGEHLNEPQRRWYYILLTGISAAVVVHNVSLLRGGHRAIR